MTRVAEAGVKIRRGLGLALTSLLAGLGLPGCQPPDNQDIPNRVLDRPTDAVLVCVQVECSDLDGDGEESDDECETVPQPLSLCHQDTGTCTSDNPHLVGFVANSERNEIAMFTKCANRLVDMDVETPGYNFIPVGVLPTDMAVSGDSCRVIAGNVGSCDLSVLDAPALAGFGLGRTGGVDEPSSLVSTLEPRRFDLDSGSWVPLGARPGEIVAVPRSLSQAPGLDPDTSLAGLCDPLARGSVYASFPTCNLVAEIDVQTGHVLQSRQFLSDGMGGVEVVDAGVSPACPVECPTQFEGGLPGDLPQVDQAGPFPQALELQLPAGPGALDPAEELVEGQSLFVGGLGSDLLFEIPIEDDGEWTAESNSLELQDAGGVKRIRVSPAVNVPALDSDASQYLYVVAGDGSTRVVGRPVPADPGIVGVECETQLDPKVAPANITGCRPVSIVPSDLPPADRRGFVRGPGIRPGFGGEVTDWMFQKIYSGQRGAGPFAEPGVMAIGVTTTGTGIYVMINQERANGETTPQQLADNVNVDPAGLMDVKLFAHSLWPNPGFEYQGDEGGEFTPPASLPTVDDIEPTRELPPESGPTRWLAPSLRRIDAAYLDHSQQLDVDEDLDQQGNGAIYDEDVVRVAVHDYRSWGAGEWSLEWEGSIPGTTSSTGRVSCANPGWEGGTCLVSEPDDAQLLDETATFCEAGVLAGDKLVLGSCTNDNQCGEGRRCLRETAGGGESSGICISAQAYEERAAELRVICDNFIRDPCGEAHREFLITKAFQDRLWIQSLDQPVISHLVVEGDDPPALGEIHERFICSDEQPDGGCVDDQGCVDLHQGDTRWMCVEERCRRPCENEDECLLRRLPGPTCFGEFITYQVALRNSFRVSGPGVTFLPNLVEVDPDTGECRPTVDPEVSPLLTSRLPLPATDHPDDPDWQAIPLCSDDTVEPSNPNPCRINQARPLETLFHNIRYTDTETPAETVSALRFSNPVLSIILDLSALESLVDPVPGLDGSTAWPSEFARFSRSRIPRGYRETFRLDAGYQAFVNNLVLQGRGATYPVRIVPAPPQLDVSGEVTRVTPVAFVVDGSGPGSSSSIRGQVLRLLLGEQLLADEAFDGVR